MAQERIYGGINSNEIAPGTASKPSSTKTLYGLPRKTFIIVISVIIGLLFAGLGVGLGVGLSRRNNSTNENPPQTPAPTTNTNIGTPIPPRRIKVRSNDRIPYNNFNTVFNLRTTLSSFYPASPPYNRSQTLHHRRHPRVHSDLD
ncbi:hypothetical protein TWF281_004329 [Arthrobotrys megalospora]